MIWKIPAIVLVLWLVQSYFHLPVAITVLLGITAVMAVIVQMHLSAQRLADDTREL